MATPDFLGFAKAMPTKSPLESAIGSAVDTFQGVVKARTAMEDLAQKKMITGAMPGALARQQKKEETEQQKQDLLLKAMPSLLREKITSEQLANEVTRHENVVYALSEDQAKHNFITNQLADLPNLEQENPQLAAKEYSRIRNNYVKLGGDKDELPENYEEGGRTVANRALQRANNTEAQRKLNLLLLGNKLGVGKVQYSPEETERQKKQADLDADYEKDLNTRSQIGETMLAHLAVMRKYYKEHPENFASSKFGITTLEQKLQQKYQAKHGEGQAAVSAASNIVVDKIGQAKGLSRATNMQVELLKDTKPDPSTDTFEEHPKKMDNTELLARELIEEQKFSNYMSDLGVTRSQDKIQAWDAFWDSKPYLNKDGSYNFNGLQAWRQFFAAHPNLLPNQAKQQMLVRMGNANAQAMNNQGTLPMSGGQISTLNTIFPPQTQQLISPQDMQRIAALSSAASQENNVITNNGLIPDVSLSSMLTGEG